LAERGWVRVAVRSRSGSAPRRRLVLPQRSPGPRPVPHVATVSGLGSVTTSPNLPNLPNLPQPPQHPRFLPHVRSVAPPRWPPRAREIRALGGTGPRRVVERRRTVRRAARAERVAGRILPARARGGRG